MKIKIPTEYQIPYTYRKWYTTTNVTAACDFNLCFTFVLDGWEGETHDTRIFVDTLRKLSLHFPHPATVSKKFQILICNIYMFQVSNILQILVYLFCR